MSKLTQLTYGGSHAIERAIKSWLRMSEIRLCLWLSLSLVFSINVFPQTGGKAQYIYWTDPDFGMIRRANAQTGVIDDLVVSLLIRPDEIAFDAARGKMYWLDGQRVRRADCDGNNLEDLVTDLVDPRGLALDLKRDKLYWTDRPAGTIYRAELDGSNVENLITGIIRPYRVTVDTVAAKIYWVSLGPPDASSVASIQRADSAGSNIETLLSGLGYPRGLQVDPFAEKIYWSDPVRGKIQRSNLDGSDVVDLVTKSLPVFITLALDIPNDKMYWVNSTGSIERATLDGNNVETVLPAPGGPQGIALDLVSGAIYWTTISPDRIQRSDLDGTNVESILGSTEQPHGLALDPISATMYWTELRLGEIRRAKLDGDSIETVMQDLFSPYELALDVANERIYWSERDVGRILSADYQGENLSQIASNRSPTAVFFDAIGRKVYWLETSREGMIHRADSDGSNPDTLVTGLSYPRSLAIDGTSEKLYWSESGDIKVSNLDGSDMGFAVRLDFSVWGLEVDDTTGLLYWSADDKIQDTDPTTGIIENVITGIHQPFTIALYSEPDSMTTQFRWPRQTSYTDGFALAQNYPNPFNQETRIHFELSSPAVVKLQIFNIVGDGVRVLLNRASMPSGSQSISWHGRDEAEQAVASGIYFYRLTVSPHHQPTRTLTRKMMLLR